MCGLTALEYVLCIDWPQSSYTQLHPFSLGNYYPAAPIVNTCLTKLISPRTLTLACPINHVITPTNDIVSL